LGLTYRPNLSQHPLDFVQDQQAFVHPNGSRVSIGSKAVFTNIGTSPEGSQ